MCVCVCVVFGPYKYHMDLCNESSWCVGQRALPTSPLLGSWFESLQALVTEIFL